MIFDFLFQTISVGFITGKIVTIELTLNAQSSYFKEKHDSDQILKYFGRCL